MITTLLALISALMLSSCAHLYKETSYVTEVTSDGNLQGACNKERAQNIFILKGKKGDFTISMPVYYSYWWTGPIVLPLIPITPERNDASFIKISIVAKEDQIDREDLLTSQILIKKETDPVKLITVVVTKKEKLETFTLQFDSPKLIDLQSFDLLLPENLTGNKTQIHFEMASDVNYVPLVPVVTEKCVTE